MTQITVTLHEDQYTFLIISRSVLLRMRNVSDKSCRENQNTHFVFSFFYRTVDDVMWENILEPDGVQMTIWRMPTACWIRKAIYTHSEFGVLIPFPMQQRLN